MSAMNKIITGIIALLLLGAIIVIISPLVRPADPTPSEQITYQDPAGLYSVSVPAGWYSHPVNNEVIFTPSEEFTLPEGTEGYAIGNQMIIRVGSFDEIIDASTTEDYLRGIGATTSSEFFVARSDTTNEKGFPLTRVVMNAAAADGQTLLYVYFPGDRRVITLSHYPFIQGSVSAESFEQLVNSFTPSI